MAAAPTTPIRCVLIVNADRLYADTLRHYSRREFPSARIILAATIGAADLACCDASVDLIITEIRASVEDDVLKFLDRLRTAAVNRPTLVVTTRQEYRVLAALRGVAIEGVFNPVTDVPDQLSVALRVVATGYRYWSPSADDYLEAAAAAPNAVYRVLTALEQVVLSIVGDGCDDAVAARQLGVSPATVSTVRRDLHRKLGVQHRGELVRVAAQNGYVHFTPVGVVRPGFSQLAAAYRPRTRRRVSVASAPAA